MRGGLVIAAAVLALIVGLAGEAEARGRGFRGGARGGQAGGVVLVSSGGAAASVSRPRLDPAPGARDPGLRRVMPVLAASPRAPREVRTAEMGCEPRRVVGAGAGFCVIN
ncbi:hypothetical protein ASF49_12195 [Methylobacterium sp. Leaf104]|uniref:hypothetical protein n=1 Tax=Methylobacterium TaxID=407 RepID=UPI0006F29B97|nr:MULTISPECIES: hypothetical protein [Methylobacterium]KQP30743.1 hypothetical protein ASF49_12195 [Methylobacterium sp. Leaf104]MCI9882282.1 hypothetical protein [Methylobacterium goesingense]